MRAKVVENAPVEEIFASPLHPYTRGLFHSLPEPGRSKSDKLYTIPGMVPSPLFVFQRLQVPSAVRMCRISAVWTSRDTGD